MEANSVNWTPEHFIRFRCGISCLRFPECDVSSSYPRLFADRAKKMGMLKTEVRVALFQRFHKDLGIKREYMRLLEVE